MYLFICWTHWSLFPMDCVSAYLLNRNKRMGTLLWTRANTFYKEKGPTLYATPKSFFCNHTIVKGSGGCTVGPPGSLTTSVSGLGIAGVDDGSPLSGWSKFAQNVGSLQYAANDVCCRSACCFSLIRVSLFFFYTSELCFFILMLCAHIYLD